MSISQLCNTGAIASLKYYLFLYVLSITNGAISNSIQSTNIYQGLLFMKTTGVTTSPAAHVDLLGPISTLMLDLPHPLYINITH